MVSVVQVEQCLVFPVYLAGLGLDAGASKQLPQRGLRLQEDRRPGILVVVQRVSEVEQDQVNGEDHG